MLLANDATGDSRSKQASSQTEHGKVSFSKDKLPFPPSLQNHSLLGLTSVFPGLSQLLGLPGLLAYSVLSSE